MMCHAIDGRRQIKKYSNNLVTLVYRAKSSKHLHQLKSNTIGPIHNSLHGLEVKCKRGFASPNFASIIKDIFHLWELWTMCDSPLREMAAWVRDRLSWQPYYFTSLPTQCLTWSSIHLLSIIQLFLGWKLFFLELAALYQWNDDRVKHGLPRLHSILRL